MCIGLPQHEICGVFLQRLMLIQNPPTGTALQLLQRIATELAITRKAVDAKVNDTVLSHVRVLSSGSSRSIISIMPSTLSVALGKHLAGSSNAILYPNFASVIQKRFRVEIRDLIGIIWDSRSPLHQEAYVRLLIGLELPE